jgi:hypothetical protein
VRAWASHSVTRVRVKGRQAIPRFAPGTLLNQCQLHKTKKHSRLGVDRHSQRQRVRAEGGQAIPRFALGTLLNQCRLHKTKKHTVGEMLLGPNNSESNSPSVTLPGDLQNKHSRHHTVLLQSRRERVCCLLVLNSVTSTPQWIRQPEAAWLWYMVPRFSRAPGSAILWVFSGICTGLFQKFMGSVLRTNELLLPSIREGDLPKKE